MTDYYFSIAGSTSIKMINRKFIEKRIKIAICLCLLFLECGKVFSQKSGTIVMNKTVQVPSRKNILLPDIPGYITLKCDLHIHTVFSDGVVWPTVRIEEAWEDGLDAIAITDHIEGHPAKFPGQNQNRAYEIALPFAKRKNIILIKGGEISRDMPPGHFNALFVTDVSALEKPDYRDALNEAVNQGGFIIWNHPGWRHHQPDTTRWLPEHEEIYQNNWMHGIEVFNGKEWYPEALQWAQEKELAITGNSDIHNVLDYQYNRELCPIRPVTLIFAKERTEESIREALFSGRSATLFFNKLIGPQKLIEPFINLAIQVQPPFLYNEGFIYFEIKNISDIEFTFLVSNKEDSGLPDRIILPRRSTIVLKVKQDIKRTYTFKLANVLIGTERYGSFSFIIDNKES